MKLTSVKIQNYRSFDSQGVEITLGEMAAFVGRNSSGKSNILNALKHFFDGSSMNDKDFYYGDTTLQISISVVFSVNDSELSIALLPYVSPNGIIELTRIYTVDNLKGTMMVSGSYEYSGHTNMNPFPTRRTNSIQIEAFLKTEESVKLRRFAQLAKIELDANNFNEVLASYWCAHASEYRQKWVDECKNLNGPTQKAILEALPKYYYIPVNYSASEATTDKYSHFQQIYQEILGDADSILSGERVKKLKQQVDSLFKESGISRRCDEMNKLLQSISGADSSVKMRIEIGDPDFRTLIHPTATLRVDDGYDCDVQNKGQGIQRDAIFRLLRVFSQLKKERGRGFILGVDEPEAFMHPTYKRRLYKSFLALCKAGYQVMYTTHDPAFVSVSRFDDIHIVAKKGIERQYSIAFNSSLHDLMKKKAFRSVCKGRKENAIRKELEHKCHGEQNEGFFADRIVLVEGETEKYALPIYLEKFGYDLDDNNTVLITAESKNLLVLMCSIFSSCRIPCYCIFDADMPEQDVYERFCLYQRGNVVPANKEEEDKFKSITQRISLNRELLEFLCGDVEDFPQTSVQPHYTVWEKDFENAIQNKLLNCEKMKAKLTREEGVVASSKPLVAYHLASECKKTDILQETKEILEALITKIKNAECLDLQDAPSTYPLIRLCDEPDKQALPVYSSAAGRNTFAYGDPPVSYAYGTFPEGTTYIVHIQGDSMEGLIPDDSYVAVRKIDEFPTPGTIGIFRLESGEMVCKRYLELKDGRKVLKSQNTKYKPIILTPEVYCKAEGEVLKWKKTQLAVFERE